MRAAIVGVALVASGCGSTQGAQNETTPGESENRTNTNESRPSDPNNTPSDDDLHAPVAMYGAPAPEELENEPEPGGGVAAYGGASSR